MKTSQNKVTAEFTEFDSSSNWVYGKTSDGFNFEAKLYNVGSIFGIKDGRVSKLWISNSENKCVANYDRGWDLKVSKEAKKSFSAIMELLENSPKRDL